MSRCELPRIRFPWSRRGTEVESECWEWVPPRINKIPPLQARPVLRRPATHGGWIPRWGLSLPRFLRRPNWKIGKFDVVELKRDVCNWPAGTRGIVSGDEDRSKVIKIEDEQGRLLALLVVPERELHLVAQPIWTRVAPDASARSGPPKLVEISDEQG